MLTIDAGGSTRRYCDGMTRRSFVRIGAAGMASTGLARILQAKEASGQLERKDTRVIFVWIDGGPSHIDLYDMKPDAPPEYRGIWTPIRTNVPGIEITEMFPKQAKVADKFSIVRSLHHNNGDHFAGAHAMLTSRLGASGADQKGKYPSIGSIATAVLGSRTEGLPPYVSVPRASTVGLPIGYFGANYLGDRYNPFETNGDPTADKFQVENLKLPGGMTVGRLQDRKTLLEKFDRLRRDVDASGVMDAMDRFEQQAYDMVVGEKSRKAFDMSQEPKAVRDRYGRHPWSQSMLLARRLAEAGVTFTTVHLGGWDNHWDLQAAMESSLPNVDAGLSALFTDLAERDLMEKVLVVVCGEFGRTPKMNNGGNGGPPLSKGTPGRDHWGNAMFCLFSGGGLNMGQVVGRTNSRGENPVERAVTPSDIHATIYHVLGVDPSVSFLNYAGRPVPAIDSGKPIAELVS